MDVILRDQATVVVRPCVFNCMTEHVPGSSLSVVPFFPGLILFALAMVLGPVPVTASQIVPPIPTSDWEYRYVRCNTWQGPFKNEIDAATTGLNNIYGACGDQYISDWGRWGTLQEGVRGPCGSTKYHPSSTWDFKNGIEVRGDTAGICLSQACLESEFSLLAGKKGRSEPPPVYRIPRSLFE